MIFRILFGFTVALVPLISLMLVHILSGVYLVNHRQQVDQGFIDFANPVYALMAPFLFVLWMRCTTRKRTMPTVRQTLEIVASAFGGAAALVTASTFIIVPIMGGSSYPVGEPLDLYGWHPDMWMFTLTYIGIMFSPILLGFPCLLILSIRFLFSLRGVKARAAPGPEHTKSP